MDQHMVRIDRSIPLAKQPDPGHNRWHPDTRPVVTCSPGDEVEIETRDAFNHQFTLETSTEDVAAVDLNLVPPLTGPVAVEGAEPGDLLVVEILEVRPSDFGYNAQVPGFGFLREELPEPFIVKGEIADGVGGLGRPPRSAYPRGAVHGDHGDRSLAGSAPAHHRA